MTARTIHVFLVGTEEAPIEKLYVSNKMSPVNLYFLRNFLEKEVNIVTGLTVPVPEIPNVSQERVSPTPMLTVNRKYDETTALALKHFINNNDFPFHVLFIESDLDNEVVIKSHLYSNAQLANIERDDTNSYSTTLVGDVTQSLATDLFAKTVLEAKFPKR